MSEYEKLSQLEEWLRVMLPEVYQDSYESLEPVSMGSAALKYDAGGRVAWDRIWGSFCDLAMAGGPPHKGKLLEPGDVAEIETNTGAHADVVSEIVRGLRLAACLEASVSSHSGWVEVDCGGHGMAGWLARAIVMENISAEVDGAILRLPAAPSFRVAKEVKNVVTSAAKTCHYWRDHMSAAQRRDIGNRISILNAAAPLLQPGQSGKSGVDTRVASKVAAATGLVVSNHGYRCWIGFECGRTSPAIWMMRALVAKNIMARREETTLFVPLNVAMDPEGNHVTEALAEVVGYARQKGLLQPG